MTYENRTALVVDDVRDWQVTLSGILLDIGLQVVVAGSREEALRLVGAGNVDLAVIDVRLDETVDEDTSGVTLARDLKSLRPAVKIILITGYETRTTIAAAYAPGTDGHRVIEDFIPKTHTEDLVQRVRELLAS